MEGGDRKEQREEEEEEEVGKGGSRIPPQSISFPPFTTLHNQHFTINDITYLDWDDLSTVYIHTGYICSAQSLTT